MGKARGAAQRPGGVARGAGAAGPGGRGGPRSTISRRDRARPRGQRAAEGPGRAGGRGAGGGCRRLGLAGTAARARQVLGRGAGAPACAARGCLPGAPPGKTAPDGPALGRPRHPRPGTVPLWLPCEAFNKLGRRPPTGAGPRLGERGAAPGRPHRTPTAAGARHLPPEALVGEGGELGGSRWSARGAEERAL